MGFKKYTKGTHNAEFFMAVVNPFVLQTSRDYDMPYHIVMKYYNNNKKDGVLSSDFYTDLEEYIKNRSENS